MPVPPNPPPLHSIRGLLHPPAPEQTVPIAPRRHLPIYMWPHHIHHRRPRHLVTHRYVEILPNPRNSRLVRVLRKRQRTDCRPSIQPPTELHRDALKVPLQLQLEASDLHIVRPEFAGQRRLPDLLISPAKVQLIRCFFQKGHAPLRILAITSDTSSPSGNRTRRTALPRSAKHFDTLRKQVSPPLAPSRSE